MTKKIMEFGNKNDKYYCKVEIDKDKKFHGKEEIFLSGIKSLEKNYKHGKNHGKTKEFNKDGIKIFEASFKNGKLNGKIIYYDDNGNTVSEFLYKDDKLIKHDA